MLDLILSQEGIYQPFGWGSVSTTSQSLVSAIRLAALVDKHHIDVARSNNAKVTANQKQYHLNSYQYQLEAVMNASDSSKSLSESAVAMLTAIDTTWVFPAICSFCQSRLPPFDDIHDNIMIRYSARIMAGDQYLDDGMSRNRSTARAYSSLLLSRYRKDRRSLLNFCGGTCVAIDGEPRH